MSKSIKKDEGISTRETTALPCIHLFGGQITTTYANRTQLHQHEFWQMDIVLAGQITAKAEKKEMQMSAGEVIFLPPETIHGFDYPPNVTHGSIKFLAKKVGPWRVLNLRTSKLLRALEKALVELIPQSSQAPIDQSLSTDCVLSAVFTECYLRENTIAPELSLTDQVSKFVRNLNGQHVSIEDVADHIGYSISHASALFRKEAGLSLKAFLDHERGRVMARLVRYADLNLTQIAYQMGFPDAFTFSRFFKRVHGTGPRAYRKKFGTS